MLRFGVGIILILHGLIVAAQSAGSFGPGSGVKNPSWVDWWPTALGESWALSKLGLERSAVSWLGGLLWLVSGLLLIAAGLGVLDVLIPHSAWRSLAVAGAGISLFMLFVYLHPLLIIGVLLDVAILVAILWADWPAASDLN